MTSPAKGSARQKQRKVARPAQWKDTKISHTAKNAAPRHTLLKSHGFVLRTQAAISQLLFDQDGSSESLCSISTHSPAFDQSLHAPARPPQGHRANLYLSPTPKPAPSPQHHSCGPDCKQRRRILPLPRKLQNSGLAKRTKESQPRLARRQVPAPNDQKARKNKSAFNALPDDRVAHFDPPRLRPVSHTPSPAKENPHRFRQGAVKWKKAVRIRLFPAQTHRAAPERPAPCICVRSTRRF